MARARENILFHMEAKGNKDVAAAFNEVTRAAEHQGRVLRNSNGNYKEAAKGMRMMRGGAAQLGYQIQDIAVQLQMGQNAFLVLGQQGSQIASIFGPGGAALGALIAVGGALVQTALRAEKAADATGELANRIRDLDKAFKDLTKSQQEQLRLDYLLKAKELTEQIHKNNEELKEQTRLEQLYQQQKARFDAEEDAAKQSSIAQAMAATAKALDDLNKVTGDNVAEMQTARDELIGLTQEYNNYTAGIESANEAKQNEFGTFLDNFKAEMEIIEQRKKAYESAEEAIMRTRVENAERIAKYEDELYQRKLEKEQERKEAEKNTMFDNLLMEIDIINARADAEKEANEKMAESHKAYKDAVLTNSREMFGGVGSMLKEGSRAQQAAFAVQKGIAIAEAIMNLHQAVSQANAEKAPFPVKLAMIAKAVATGTAAIAGVKSASFEGGGYTGMGSRTGGVDGRGGFPAILHPNETVIDHTKGGGGVNVNFTINAVDTKGFDELLATRRGQIMSMVNDAVNNRGRASLG